MSAPPLFFDLDGTLTDPREGITRCLQHAIDGLDRPARSAAALERFIGPPLHDAFAEMLETDDPTTIGRAVPMWVVTSKPEVYARRIVEHFEVAGFSRVVYGPDLDGTRSDKRELMAHVLGREQLPASNVWMIGDRSHDVVAARANGVASVGALWGYGTRRELQSAGADAVVTTVSELVEHVRHAPPGASR